MRRGKQKGWCRRCKKYFTIQPHQFSTRDCAIASHHLDGIPYRKLVRTYHATKNTLNKIVNAVLAQFITNTELTKQLALSYEDGIFLADGKFFRCKRLVTLSNGKVAKRKYPRGRCQLSIMHWQSHDIPVTVYAETENFLSWLTAWKQVKELGITVRYVVADDKSACAQALKQIFPAAILETCHAHFIREVERKLCFRSIERRLNKLGREIDRLMTGLQRPGNNAWKTKAIALANQMAEIEDKHCFLFDFVALLKDVLTSKTTKEKETHWQSITKEWFPLYDRLAPDDPHRKKIRSMWRKVVNKEKQLFAYLRVDITNDVPKTTNVLEGWHNQIELRCNSIRGFESPKTGDAYMNALTLWRRFRKFTDCKGQFKQLNGTSPLEAAGATVDRRKNWILTVLKSDQS